MYHLPVIEFPVMLFTIMLYAIAVSSFVFKLFVGHVKLTLLFTHFTRTLSELL